MQTTKIVVAITNMGPFTRRTGRAETLDIATRCSRRIIARRHRSWVAAAEILSAIVVLGSSAYAQVGSSASAEVGWESYAPRPMAATTPMRVEVLSGTTFADIETRQVYRLYGIDACDPGQTARLGKQNWPCGVVATAWLVTATLNKWVACTTIRRQDAIRVARCATGELPDLAAEMLKTGHAVTLPSFEDRLITSYAQLEHDARRTYRGLWASAFQMPWRFRRPQPAEPEAP